MAVIDLPYDTLVDCYFEKKHFVANVSVGGGAKFNTSRMAADIWEVHISTIEMFPDGEQRANWRAFKSKLAGGVNLFRAYDASKKTPLAYKTAKSSNDIQAGWNGTATVDAIGASGVITLSGLPPNYILSPADYIGLEENDKYDLHDVHDLVVTDGLGVATVTVGPFFKLGIFTTGAVARIWRPYATFTIDNDSWKESGHYDHDPISFSGTQRVL